MAYDNLGYCSKSNDHLYANRRTDKKATSEYHAFGHIPLPSDEPAAGKDLLSPRSNPRRDNQLRLLIIKSSLPDREECHNQEPCRPLFQPTSPLIAFILPVYSKADVLLLQSALPRDSDRSRLRLCDRDLPPLRSPFHPRNLMTY